MAPFFEAEGRKFFLQYFFLSYWPTPTPMPTPTPTEFEFDRPNIKRGKLTNRKMKKRVLGKVLF